MARALATIMIGLFLTGCGKHYWQAERRGVVEFQADSGSCIQEAKSKYGVSESIYRGCMRQQTRTIPIVMATSTIRSGSGSWEPCAPRRKCDRSQHDVPGYESLADYGTATGWAHTRGNAMQRVAW